MEATIEPETVAGLISGVAGIFGCLGYLVVAVILCALLHVLYKTVPAEYRQLAPGLVWLLVIPLFNLIWNFWVFPRLSRSYQIWFEAKGDTTKGTCNSGLAWAYSIVAACTILVFIPCLGVLIGVASLVLLIIYLVQMFGLKSQALAVAPVAAAPEAPAEPETPTPPPTDMDAPGGTETPGDQGPTQQS